MLRRRDHAVVGREIEQQRVVRRHDRRVRLQDAALTHGGDDVGCNALATVCGELLGGRSGAPPEAVCSRSSAATTSTTSTPPSGWAPRVAGRGAGRVARRRRTGESARQRADRSRRLQHARLDEREERPQHARESRHGVALLSARTLA